MSGHTPGPWTVDGRGIRQDMRERERGWFIGYCEDTHNPDWKANARLVAAAPDLLEALQGLLLIVPVSRHLPSIELARRAIARATGEARS
jgi:hypothetical protein